MDVGAGQDGSVREVRASGREAVMLATDLLQRARRAEPTAGLWEAADLQWWWRRPRRSDDIEQLFWVDHEGPVAAVFLTSWADDTWQCDPMVVPGASGPDLAAVWGRAWEQVVAHVVGAVEVLVRDDDWVMRTLVQGSGLAPGDQGSIAWMEAADRPGAHPLPEGFTLVDRTQRSDTPHPMRHRNGEGVQERLAQCPLYDPELDLAVETADGTVAGYSLYWSDPATGVGLVEPVRVEDEFHRLGLARAMLGAGLDRLAAQGAQRLKIGFGTEAASALYQSLGFRPTSTDTTYAGRL